MIFSTATGPLCINTASRAALFRAVGERFAAGDGFALATLNLDHLTRLPWDEPFAKAYAAQDFVVADGRPAVWLTRIAGQPVALMPGSDLVIPLCEEATRQGATVALLGSSPAALDASASALEQCVPGLRIVHRHAPDYGFDPMSAAADAALKDVAASGAQLCFLALGAPKQEVLAARGRLLAPHVGFASIGAGLDFLAGHQRRAPQWMRALALEWLWRALQSPRRLIPRYARCFAILPGLTVQALRQRFR